MNRHRVAVVLICGLLGLAAILISLSALQIPGKAQGGRAEHTVCPAGSPTCDFGAIQEAVDAAGEGDVIKVAAGTYSGIQGRPVPAGYLNPPPGGVISQVVYLSQTLTLQGGYTTTDWFTPDPEANPTIVDAGGSGRVLVIAGYVTPTIEGLRFTGGNAGGLGGYSGANWDPFDAGGGLCVVRASAILSDNVIYGNTAGGNGSGGGLYLLDSDAVLRGNTVTTNTANSLYGGGMYTLYSEGRLEDNTFSGNSAGWGGAVFLEFSPATLTGNDFLTNTCIMAGGALNVHTSDATITGNTLAGNEANQAGGAARLYDSAAVLRDNLITGNTSNGYGGGLHLWESPSTLISNTLSANTSATTGGGLEFWLSDATLINNVIAGNQAGDSGTAMYVVWASSPRLLHNTIAANTPTGSSDGSGIYVAYYQAASSPWLTNTIVAGHTVGVYVSPGNSANLEATLWGGGPWSNGTDWDGAGAIDTGTVNVWGDPAFVDPGAGDYHLTPGSAAEDAGLDAGITLDIDGQPRPMGLGFDIGADEVPATAALTVAKYASADPVQAGAQLTYTLYLTNTGTVSLSATITDVLPAQVTPGGQVVWTPPPLLPGGIWTETIVVTVAPDYAGPLANVVQASTEEGAGGTCTRTVEVLPGTHLIYLPLTVRDF